jgi:hypothetical protein
VPETGAVAVAVAVVAALIAFEVCVLRRPWAGPSA